MRKTHLRPKHQRAQRPDNAGANRQGSIIVLATALMIVILGFTVFTVDVGYITLSKAQLQNAVDAGALAAVQEFNISMDDGEIRTAARQAAIDVAAAHRAGDHASVSVEGNLGDIEFGRRVYDPVTGEYLYVWGLNAVPHNCVRVTARRSQVFNQQGTLSEDNQLPLFFGPILGASGATIQAQAIATFHPRDIMIVIDGSASMNDDSELKSIDDLGQQAIEDNIQQMWEELGSPTYGNMDFIPDWVTIPGQPANGNIPHIDVTWKGTEVLISSTKDLSNVVLEFDGGVRERFENLGHLEGLPAIDIPFVGTGANQGKLIRRVWVKSGSNFDFKLPIELNGYGEEFDFFDNADIARGLGLDNVPYPYPSGDWGDYIEYARSHNSSMPWYDRDVFDAGYRRKFGMLTLINFWNANKPAHSETPDLWKVSQQPITALKDSVDVMVDYLLAVAADDNVGIAIYNSDSGDALLELGLDYHLNEVKTVSRQRQAGHYDRYTNIGAGLRTARQELEANARPAADKWIILITDGQANRSSTGASPTQFALDEASLAANSRIRIMTISLGAGADQALMQQIADIGNGNHFNIPGGQSVAQYETQLKQVFGEIAADRPLKLIQVP